LKKKYIRFIIKIKFMTVTLKCKKKSF